MNYLLAIVIAGAVLIFGLAWFNESQATKIKAEAHAQSTIIRAEAQARTMIIEANANANAVMTQANAALMIAAFPVTVAIFGGIVGLLCAVALLVFVIRWQPRRVIEQRVIIQIGPGQPRREAWQALSATRADLLEARKDDTKTIVAIR